MTHSTSKGYCVGTKFAAKKKEGPRCFNCGGSDHFSKKCKSMKVYTNEDYEVKYKKLLASLKRQNINVIILVIELET